MNQNPIIKALQKELAKERNESAVKYESKCMCGQDSYKYGHEAASARLLGLLEKAVEVIEDVAKMHPDANPIFRIEKAREFLLSISKEIK